MSTITPHERSALRSLDASIIAFITLISINSLYWLYQIVSTAFRSANNQLGNGQVDLTGILLGCLCTVSLIGSYGLLRERKWGVTILLVEFFLSILYGAILAYIHRNDYLGLLPLVDSGYHV